MSYICIIEMSFHLWENKTNQNNQQTKPTLVDILSNISWEDKARKAIAWGITAGSDALAGQ